MTGLITVDRRRCDGRGVCAEMFPEVIALDDWGYPIVAGGIVPDELLPLARLAVLSCPVLALRLTAQGRRERALTGDSQRKVTVL